MKKIYNIILTVTALLAFAPFAGAQTYGQYSIKGQIKDPVDGSLIVFPKDNGLQGNTDFAYSKNVSAPFDDGTYWIKLESYATGSASRIEAAAPADIVLVLDLSSSMTQSRTVIDGYQEATTPNNGWTPNAINSGTYYILYEGEYYRVRRGGRNNSRNVYFDLEDNTRCYLVNNSVQVGGNPPSVRDNAVVYNGTLYTLQSHSETRLAALKRATKAFIDQIEKNDKYEDEAGTVPRTTRLGNRISLITFNSSATTHNTLAEGYLKDAEGGSPSTAEYLKGLVDGFTTVTGTTPYNGFVAANAQLATIDASRMAAASRTVVFFTDGEPYDANDGNGSYPSNPTNAYRYKAIAEALKSKTKDNPETDEVEGYDATVFSVGLFTSSPETGSTTWNFLNYVSSNAPNATAINNAGADFDASKKFYYDASDASVDLTAVFTEIASQSGGTSSSLSAASSNVDAVSSSFMLPSDITASTVSDKVKIFIAKVNDTATKNNGGTLVFDEEILKGHLPSNWTFAPLDENGAVIPNVDPKMADDGITISLIGDNGIKVKGFDYSSCFCGPIYEDDYEPTGTDADKSHVDHYQGYKIIIMIPIEANPDAVGGPNVDTNAPGSGIFITDGDQTAFVSYKSPTVSLPYNFFIKKSGLRPGESAKFKLERAYIPVDDDGNEVPGWTPEEDIAEEDWQYVSTIFVTQPQGASATNEPVVKVRGLPSTSDDGDYVYRISEEKWTWSYHRDAPQYTVKSKINNPFNFSNDKKDDIDIKVRHAESKATNIFNGTSTGNKVYDDSKPRKTTPSESK
ncbi:MAG: VWA domain-containing protein [Bacteroidales bacterium]|nr:VWA domain-containing protein [Bacteroidales bacterium]